MMIFDKFGILRGLFPTKPTAGASAKHWRAAATRDPELLADVLRLGGVLVTQPMIDGEVAPLDPLRLAYEAGRRDMAVQLATMMNLTIHELNSLMEDNDASH